MNRCFPFFSARCTAWRIGLLAVLLSLCAVSLAQPKLRPFPPKAVRGEMRIAQPPELFMDGKPERLSPGARIRGPNNMVQMSAALTGHTLPVMYLREPLGLIHEVWILNAAEAQALPPPP